MTGSGLRGRLAALLSRAPPADPRCVVVDTETSGLDPARDALLAIGAVAVDAGGLPIADSFEVLLRQDDAVVNASVPIHGIGGAAQRGGVTAGDALAAFVSFVADAPLIAFHAPFDRAVIDAACARNGMPRRGWRWLDVAELAPALHPELHRQGLRGLDDWLLHFRIDAGARHSAAADAMATAELFLRLRALAAADGPHDHAALARLAQARRWL
jgi:DNA polymerase-3 subunit epsilon